MYYNYISTNRGNMHSHCPNLEFWKSPISPKTNIVLDMSPVDLLECSGWRKQQAWKYSSASQEKRKNMFVHYCECALCRLVGARSFWASHAVLVTHSGSYLFQREDIIPRSAVVRNSLYWAWRRIMYHTSATFCDSHHRFGLLFFQLNITSLVNGTYSLG